MKTMIEMDVLPFVVPERLYARKGTEETTDLTGSIALSEVPLLLLTELCQEFKIGVHKAAGKPLIPKAPLPGQVLEQTEYVQKLLDRIDDLETLAQQVTRKTFTQSDNLRFARKLLETKL